MKKQTAVEWLKKRLPSLFIDDSGHYEKLFKEAKAMEKEQIEEAFKHGNLPTFFTNLETAEEYYNETYGGE